MQDAPSKAPRIYQYHESLAKQLQTSLIITTCCIVNWIFLYIYISYSYNNNTNSIVKII